MTPVPIIEYRDVDRARFEGEIAPAARPAVLRGLVQDWPLVAAARRSDETLATYLRDRATQEPAEAWFAPPEIAGRFQFNAAIDGFNHERKAATVDQLLDLLLRQRGVQEPWAIFAGGLPLARHLPEVRAANPMPLLDADRDMLVSLWLGNRTVTAAHWDLPQNLACVVSGRRRFTLFPPEQVGNLYVGPLDFTLAGQPTSLVDIDDPDLDRFPRFVDAMAVAQVAELAPGDVLYIPSLWWHAVRSSSEIGAMVNFWWRSGGWEMTPFLALFHTLLTLRDVPTAERDAWRAMFEHYAFRADGDPAGHLPAAARGVLGDPSAEQVRLVKARIARALS